MTKTIGGILALLGIIIGAGGAVYWHTINSHKYPLTSLHVLGMLGVGVIVLAIGIYGLVRPGAAS